jgi:hypothetical protein
MNEGLVVLVAWLQLGAIVGLLLYFILRVD